MASKLTLTVGDRHAEVRVEQRDGDFTVWLDDVPYAAEWLPTNESGLYSLLLNGHSYEVFVRRRQGGYELLIGNRVYEVGVGRGRDAAGQTVTGAWTLNSPMTGQVVELKVATGDEVQQGQVLVVVESMKMNNELVAARAGRIVDLQVGPGTRVDKGRPLLRIE